MPQGLVSEAEAIQIARGKAFEQEIGVCGEVFQLCRARFGGDIQGDAALSGGEGPPDEAALGVRVVFVEGAEPANGIAVRGLNGDDFGAEIGEDFAGKDANFAGEIQDSVGG